MANEGFVLFDSQNGQLAEDGVEQIPLMVVAGVEYAVVGVCDSDCVISISRSVTGSATYWTLTTSSTISRGSTRLRCRPEASTSSST